MNRNIKNALARIQSEIRGDSAGRGHIASGLSREGYAGGYEQALLDIDLALRGIKPGTRGYWDDWREPKRKTE